MIALREWLVCGGPLGTRRAGRALAAFALRSAAPSLALTRIRQRARARDASAPARRRDARAVARRSRALPAVLRLLPWPRRPGHPGRGTEPARRRSAGRRLLSRDRPHAARPRRVSSRRAPAGVPAPEIRAWSPRRASWPPSADHRSRPSPPPARSRRGQQLFALDCAGCHTIQARGGVVTGAFVPPSRRHPPSDRRGHPDRSLRDASVRTGPSSRRADRFDRTLRAEHRHPADPGGWDIGRIGPITEGMAAWLLAIVALLLSPASWASGRPARAR